MTMWISWEEASARTGIRVPTIEHAVRVGRIARRPRHGTRPTLDAEAVEVWAAEYHRQRAEKAQQRKNAKVYWPLRRREDGWLKTSEAAAALGVSPSTAHRLAALGLVEAEGGNGGWRWFNAASVEAYKAEEARWVSWEQAAELLGASTRHDVQRLIAEGQLTTRAVTGSRPSVLAEAVISYRPTWQAAREAREAAARARAAQHAWSRPPDDGHKWIGVAEAAAILGLSPSGVRLRLNTERLPGIHRRRWWMRREHIEQVARAERVAALPPHRRVSYV